MSSSKPSIRPLLLLMAFFCVFWGAYLGLAFVGFFADPLWYLEPARNWAFGEGLVTRILYPAQVAHYPPGLTLPAPPLHHGPLALLLIGIGYRLFGVSDWVPLAYSFGATLLSGVLVYRMGLRTFGQKAGLTAAAFFWSNLMIISDNTAALTDPLFILLVTWAAWKLWSSGAEARNQRLNLVLAGLALGLASCTRLAGQAYWLGFALAAFWLHRSVSRVGIFLAGLAVPLSILAAYNYAAAGFLFYSPGFYVLLWSKSFPGFRASTSYLNMTSTQALLAYPRDIFQKCLTGVFYAVNRFFEKSEAPWLAFLIASGLLNTPSQSGAGAFRVFALLISAPVVLINLLISYGAVHYLQPVFPLFIVVAASWFWRFVEERANWLGRVWIGLPIFALFLLSPTILAAKEGWKSRQQRRQLLSDQASLGAFIANRSGPRDVIYTDDPPTVAWHARRGAVSLGATLEDSRKTLEHLPARTVVLTSLRIHSEDYDDAWRLAFARKNSILGFEPCAEFKSPTLTALLMRRPGDCREDVP